jgi:hypothetical protein
MGPKPRGTAVTPDIPASKKVLPFTIEEHCSNAGAAFHCASLTIDAIMESF